MKGLGLRLIGFRVCGGLMGIVKGANYGYDFLQGNGVYSAPTRP